METYLSMEVFLRLPWRMFTVELQNDYVLGFIIREIFTVITLEDRVGWGIFTVIPGYPESER